MTQILQKDFPGTNVEKVDLIQRDDGTNRRARFALSYDHGVGPRTVFAKAESDVPGRREIHSQNGNLFNEPLLFRSNIDLPLEHPKVYASLIDEAGLDYLLIFEDLNARGADPLNATRPLTVGQVAQGLEGLARLHSRFWGSVAIAPDLAWVRHFEPTPAWQKLIGAAKLGLEPAGDCVPGELRSLTSRDFVRVWTDYVRGLVVGQPTLLHGDPHIGNTYLLPDGTLGFLDWQVVRSGSWVHDVGYFVQSALTVEDRRRSERELLEHYLGALEIAADERPPAAEAWLRYRATPAYGLPIWLITLLSDVHSRERILVTVQRFATAFSDLDAPSAVDELVA